MFPTFLLPALRPAPPQAAAAAVAATQPTRPPTTAPSVAEARIETAAEGYRLAMQAFESGVGGYGDVAAWSRRMCEAAAHPSVPPERRLAVLRGHLGVVRQFEEVADKRFKAGMAQRTEVVAGRYARLEVEQWIEDAERPPPATKPAAAGAGAE